MLGCVLPFYSTHAAATIFLPVRVRPTLRSSSASLHVPEEMGKQQKKKQQSSSGWRNRIWR